YPSFPPFQGMVPGPPPQRGPGAPGAPPGAPGAPGLAAAGPGGPAGSPTFPTHPYARSPRDFFMYYDNDEPSYTPGSYAPLTVPASSPIPYSSTPPAPPAPPAQPVPAVPPAPQPPEEKLR